MSNDLLCGRVVVSVVVGAIGVGFVVSDLVSEWWGAEAVHALEVDQGGRYAYGRTRDRPWVVHLMKELMLSSMSAMKVGK